MSKNTSHVLKKLRSYMKDTKFVSEAINAYIIPSGDAHQSEYIAPCFKRREFITGFTGSAGTAIVTDNEALLWTDGRYFLQAEKQLDHNWTLMKDGMDGVLKKEEWLKSKLSSDAVIGVDPYLLSLDEWRRYAQELKNSDKRLIRIDHNLVDLVWQEYGQPDPPSSSLIALQEEYAGKSWECKIKEVRENLEKENIYAVVVAALDEVAWLFNLRGSDIEFNPVFMSYAIVSLDEVILFLDESRITNNIKRHLKLDDPSNSLKVLPYNDIQETLRKLGNMEKKIWISSRSSCALASLVPEKYLVTKTSPVCHAKAVKNSAEIGGMKNSHIRDAAALCEYFCWLEEKVKCGDLNELDASDKLDSLRAEQKDFVSLSFATISSAGPNCAVIHYRPEKSTALTIDPNSMYLCDSGGQYLDGTTDVTRTIHFNQPTDHEKECFTRVLKGHIQLAMTTFPNGTTGHFIDVLARKSLWDVGLDYVHGTGHGVGAFLNVHEGPIGISPKRSDDPPLKSGMFVTIEPGYYEDGNFGIRIENVYLIKHVDLRHNFSGRGYLGLEPVTLVPIQLKLIAPKLLTPQEIDWLNSYHDNVREKVGSYLKERNKHDVYKWLLRETQTIG